MLYKSIVSVYSMDGERQYGATSEEASRFVERGFAVAISEGRAFCGKIQLTLSLAAIRDEIRPNEKPKGRPRPTLNPASSAGDAGRGFTHGPRYRILHMERQAALR